VAAAPGEGRVANAAARRKNGSHVGEVLDRAPPSVSVIVAVYNAAATLGECIDSLLRLDYPCERLQLLFVDNASSDASRDVLRAGGGRLTMLHEPRRGPAAARNRGLGAATGEVVALTDADCVVDRAWLRHLVVPLAAPGVGLAGGTILSKRPCNSIEAYGEQIHDHDRAINEYTPPYVITMNWAARRELVARLGGFNEDLLRGSDVDFSYRVLATGGRLVYVPDAIVHHRNERTPWGLVHEGYVHAYHNVALRRLHAELRERMRPERAARIASRRSPHPRRLPPPRLTPLWSSLFQMGKRLGALAARRRIPPAASIQP
jgi:cellulose synthase/poly-beta-1,6-N-acetylglucosamine synthase-like glycosyltransferase